MRSSPNQLSSSANYKEYIPALLFVSWLGTYLDIILVGKKLFSFPARPLPELFSFNAVSTLLVLPFITAIAIYWFQKMARWQRIVALAVFGLMGMLVEQISERLGWFAHSGDWSHFYSFFGYMLVMWLAWKMYRWFV